MQQQSFNEAQLDISTSIKINRTFRSSLHKVNFEELEFGKYVSDHMLVCDYEAGEWHPPQIVPFANLSLSPTTLALHYGQTVFEGMKAFKMKDGTINIFRIDKHYERFVNSLKRMCMAVVPRDVFVEGLSQLISVDKGWVPKQKGSALYLRPFVFASEGRFGLKVSENYRFVIFTGPVPPLYSIPVKVKVETTYVRAAKGGTGAAKCGGNYGGSFLPTQYARQEGFDQVLWTDSIENKYIEESGTMNVMFVIDNKLVTPPLSDSILDGVTRDSLLTLASHLNYQVEEKQISIQDLKKAFENKSITEAFGAGTAALIAPISIIHIDGTDYQLPLYNESNMMSVLKSRLDNIRCGLIADEFKWNYIIN